MTVAESEFKSNGFLGETVGHTEKGEKGSTGIYFKNKYTPMSSHENELHCTIYVEIFQDSRKLFTILNNFLLVFNFSTSTERH